MRHLLPFLVVAAMLLSGCASTKDPALGTSAPTDPGVPTDASPTPTEDPNQFVPKFHTHNYWAGRKDVLVLSDAPVVLGEDTLKETTFSNAETIIGQQTFTTKIDGDNSGLSADRSDVIYQGTSRLEVTVKWQPNNQLPGVKFLYKPASTSEMLPLGPVENGKTYTINMKKGWADMPHQLALSRWKFKLEAYDPAQANNPYKVHYAKGTVFVTIRMFDGGDSFIDPPHPYFFTKSNVRYAGEANATLTNCVVVNNTDQTPVPNPMSSPVFFNCPTSGPRELRVDQPHIIPWETTRATIELFYNYTGQSTAIKPLLGLTFHGSDGEEYRYPKATHVAAGHEHYEVGVTEVMTDSPYASQSDWRFGVYPILQEQKDYGGEFTGNIHLYVRAYNDGSAGRGMGN